MPGVEMYTLTIEFRADTNNNAENLVSEIVRELPSGTHYTLYGRDGQLVSGFVGATQPASIGPPGPTGVL